MIPREEIETVINLHKEDPKTTMAEHTYTPKQLAMLPPGQRIKVYITVGYSPDQPGEWIQNEDVVHPKYHKWTVGKEAHAWSSKSRACCPTYGSCECCFNSGPVGK